MTENDFFNYKDKAYLLIYNGLIVEIGFAFTQLTGYSAIDVLQKDISETMNWLLKRKLRANEIENNKVNSDLFLFTKSCEVKEILISVHKLNGENEKLYLFTLKSNAVPGSDNSFVKKLMKDNHIGVGLYSCPDFRLLQANPKYLGHIQEMFNPKESIIGLCLKDFIQDFEIRKKESCWSNILRTGQSIYLEEIKCSFCKGDDRYWNDELIPINEEGKVKYIVSMLSDVTEKVLNRKKIEEQNQVIRAQKRILEKEAIDSRNSRNNVTNALGKIRDIMHSTFDFDELMKGVVLEAAQTIKSETAVISLRQEGKWVVSYAQGFSNDTIGICTYDEEETHAVLAMQTKKPVFIRDIYHDERVNCEHMKNLDIRSVIVVPILVKGNVIGVIFFNYYKEVLAFEDVIVEFINSFTSAISMALVNLNLNADMGREILKGKKIEEKIFNQDKILKRQEDLLNISTEAIFAWHLNGEIIYWNKGASKKYGYSIDEAIGSVSKDLLKSVYPTTLDHIKAILMKDELWNGEIEHTSKDGKKLIVKTNMKLVLNEVGDQIVLETNRDITGRRRMEKELLFNKELLEVVIENIQDPFAIYDKRGNLLKINVAGRKLYPRQDLIKTLESVFTSFECFDLDGNKIPITELPSRRALKGEFVKNAIIVIKRDDCDQITEVNSTPIYDSDNNLVCIAIFHRDVSQKYHNLIMIKEQQDKILLTEIEKNEDLKKTMDMKDEFLSLISHEFKTPLTIINSAVQTMEIVCKNELTDKAINYLNKIQQNSNRQLKLVNNILDNTRMDSGHFKLNMANRDIVFLTRTITESITVFAERKDIKITFYSTLAKKIIGIDEEQYERILLNLLSNAVKFSLEGTLITVKVFQILVNGNYKVHIEVKDNGIGIPEDKQELIFERFGQVDSILARQAEGSGIGLSLVKKLVGTMGGEIKLESEEGVGSTFTIIIPAIKLKKLPLERTLIEKCTDRIIGAKDIEFSDVY